MKVIKNYLYNLLDIRFCVDYGFLSNSERRKNHSRNTGRK